MKINKTKMYEFQAKSGKTLEELGLPRTTLQNIRKGRNVRPQTVYKFAEALGCSVEELIEKEV